MTAIEFPEVARPTVTVVIVAYGAGELVQRTLRALRANTPPVYEVVVVDNASPDDTLTRLRATTTGVEILANPENVGFAAAANQGARAGSGRAICILNSDVLVEPGWLDPLLEALADPEVGSAIPLILNVDGTVQEAGSVIDSDGWALALGDGDAPEACGHRFRREIDFGSAACLMTRRDVFRAAGGLAEVYGPGYYEDVDYAFVTRERGYRTVLEPRSQVVHLRFGSSSGERARQLVVANRDTFLARWHGLLSERPTLREVFASETRLVAARDLHALDRVLVVDDRIPHVDQGSGDPRMAQLLTQLVELWPRARVTLLAAEDRNRDTYARPLQDAGVEVAAPGLDFPRWFETRRFHFSTVVVSRPQNLMRFEHHLRRTQPQASFVFDAEALSSRRLARMARVVAADDGEPLLVEAARMAALERGAARSADALFAVTDEEGAVLRGLAPDVPVFLLPAFVDPLPDPAPYSEREGLVFYGGFLAGSASPNEDAVVFLIREVLPLIRRQLPDVELQVVGANPTPAVHSAARAASGVQVVGYVDEPLETLNRARVHVNPLRYGAGIKLKLLDSMAAGLPFVTTSVGAEGLRLGEAHGTLVAEDPRTLADLAISLYSDEERWRRAQRKLLSLAAGPFGRDSFRATLVDAMAHLGVAPPRRAAARS